MEKGRGLHQLKKNKMAMVGLFLIGCLLVLAVVGPWIHLIIPWCPTPSIDSRDLHGPISSGRTAWAGIS